MEKQEKKERKILTDNRMATVNKRETSFEGLVGQLENGEDGIYNLVTNDKNVIFQPKVTITKKDLEEIEPLRQLRDSIEHWEKLSKTATGRAAYIIKSTIIELRKDQYLIKNAYRQPIVARNITRNIGHYIKLPWDEWVDENGEIQYEGVSFINPVVISTILCNYSKLKEGCYGRFEGDTWYMMEDFDRLVENSLADYPLYRRIVEYKIDGQSNVDIKEMIEKEFGFTHSLEYISSLWRNKIPKLIASYYTDEWLTWYYTEKEYGKWKKCTRCGQIKLAHSRFFSINKGSRDGWYSLCKCCRNAKNKKAKE